MSDAMGRLLKRRNPNKPLTNEERAEITREMFPLDSVITPSQHAFDVDRFRDEKKKGIKVLAKVVGYCREPDCIWVLRDGRKAKTEWHRLFWERA